MNFENNQKEFRPFDDTESLLLVLSVVLLMIDERIEGRQLLLEIVGGLSLVSGGLGVIAKVLKSW